MSDEKALTKKDLIEVVGGLEHRLEGNLQRLEGLFDSNLQALEERFDNKLKELEDRLREYVHDTETKLLTAFHRYASANDERLGHLEDFSGHTTKRLAELEAAGRLSALELRGAEIEKKLDRHP